MELHRDPPTLVAWEALSDPIEYQLFFSEPSEDSSEPAERESGREMPLFKISIASGHRLPYLPPLYPPAADSPELHRPPATVCSL